MALKQEAFSQKTRALRPSEERIEVQLHPSRRQETLALAGHCVVTLPMESSLCNAARHNERTGRRGNGKVLEHGTNPVRI
jgi:hypothetical protein